MWSTGLILKKEVFVSNINNYENASQKDTIKYGSKSVE